MVIARFDVIVVGAGPAGTIAAYALARGGANVALVDKAAFPRDKACGDLVGPRGLQVLDDPQLRARRVFVEAADRPEKASRHLRTPLDFGAVRIRSAPSLGQHSREILREAGFSAQEIDELANRLSAQWPNE